MPRSSLQDRIRQVLGAREMKASVWSKRAGLAQGHVSLILSGNIKGDLRADTLKKLADAAHVSYEWLATGNGTMEPASQVTGETRVEMEPVETDADVESEIDRALFRAMDATRYEPSDFDHAREALRASHRITIAGADLATVARRALDAARETRQSGEPVNTVAILSRIAFGRS